MASSLDDQDRQELLWEHREEQLLLTIQNQCSTQEKLHIRSGKRKKLWYSVLGIPSTILPIIAATLSQMEVDNFAVTVCMLVCGCVTGMNTFFNFGKQRQTHFEYAGKYQELGMDIGLELCKPRRNRIACDVFLQGTSAKFNHINNGAPIT